MVAWSKSFPSAINENAQIFGQVWPDDLAVLFLRLERDASKWIEKWKLSLHLKILIKSLPKYEHGLITLKLN